MSTFIAHFETLVAAAFEAAGIADRVLYYPTAAAYEAGTGEVGPLQCTLDEGTQFAQGAYTKMPANRALLRLPRIGACPEALAAGAHVVVLDANDDPLAVWIVDRPEDSDSGQLSAFVRRGVL